MAHIGPFRGIIYNQSKVNIDVVIAPPYDVISPNQQNQLYEASPYNVVRLILGRESDRYRSAANYYRNWLSEQILIRDLVPSIYVLEQTFQIDGRSFRRRGFVALCKLEEFSRGVVLPHEKTMSRPKEDRLELFKATKSNFSQIFSLFDDEANRVGRILEMVASGGPFIDIVFEGVRNRLWRSADPDVMGNIKVEFKEKKLLIADGHHRYETGLAFRELMKTKNPDHSGEEPYNYMMMFLTNIGDTGLVILPTHRIVYGLQDFNSDMFLNRFSRYFRTEHIGDLHEAMKKLSSIGRHAFVVSVQEQPGLILAHLKDESLLDEAIGDNLPEEVKKLDVTLLHSYILSNMLGVTSAAQEAKSNLEYTKNAEVALDAVRTGKAQLAFLMNPTKVEDMISVVRAGHTMPQKSTYFYPKLLSGLVMNALDSP
jgi:uncharacterized protein (DUF1015 family)